MMQTEFEKDTRRSDLKEHEGAEASVELLMQNENSEEDLYLRFSLYRITLSGKAFYAVTTETSGKEEGEIAAEFLGQDAKTAETFYLRLVRGTVPPSTLREIVFDLFE